MPPFLRKVDEAATLAGSTINAGVVKAHAVDDGFFWDDAKQARLWVARLGAWGDGADLHVAKTQAAERVNAASFFIKASGEADAVGEGEAHAFDGLTGRCLGGDQAEEAKFFQPA